MDASSVQQGVAAPQTAGPAARPGAAPRVPSAGDSQAAARQGTETAADRAGGPAGQQPTKKEQRLLRHGRSTLGSAIGPSLTTKSTSIFSLCSPDGDIDTRDGHGRGLYFHDTRFLSHAALRVCGQRLAVLLSSDDQDDRAICELTNPDLPLTDTSIIPKETLGIRRERILSDHVEESIAIHNFNTRQVEVEVRLDFEADFDNMFVVRGAEPGKRGTLYPPAWDGPTLTFRYDGADGRTRTTALTFDPPPTAHDGGTARYHLTPDAASSTTVSITTVLRDLGNSGLETEPATSRATAPSRPPRMTVETDSELFNRVLNRCFKDLETLATFEQGDSFYAAGVPWYVALFGRDSIITALQTLAYDPAIAADTLRVLAQYQGTKVDPWRDEEPGKILHELRVGEKAHLHEVPQSPYYGSVDATPLFVILAGEYVRWTGDLDLWHGLRDNVDRALMWIDHYGDHNHDGFIDYESESSKGLTNQGWKDSSNSITNADGTLAIPPIALVEVQGYVYRAKHAAAFLYQQDGDHDRAARLTTEAEALKRHFQDAFWMPERNFLAVAIQKDDRQARSITSNAGQAMWSGIVAGDHAHQVANTLMDRTMFSGWGIRTMASREAAYNPIDYQVGSVWPHDNSLIAAGLKRYGRDDDVLTVFSAIFQAATNFALYRLPELWAGFGRDQYSVPVHYPVACSPQAWAAGALPYLLTTTLGLHPNAPAGELRVLRPRLPNWLNSATLNGLRVGNSVIDLRFERSGSVTLVAVLGRKGDMRVEIEY